MSAYTIRTAAREASFWVLAAVVLFPIYILISLSLKSPAQASKSPFSVPTHPTLANFEHAWNGGGTGIPSIGRSLFNSGVTTLAVVVVLIAVAGPAGYALGRRTGRLSATMSAVFVSGLILPAQLGFIPLFVAMSRSRLTGTRIGLILVYLGLLMPLAVFLYTGFFRKLPREYEEAAAVDGAGPIRTFGYVVLPLMRPISGTVALLTGMQVWNDFFTPLVFTGGTDKVTTPVDVYSFVGQYTTQWNLVFATVVIALGPVVIIYIFFQKYLIRGFESGVRG